MSAFTAGVLDRASTLGVHVIPVTARRPSTTFPAVPWATHAVCLNGCLVVDRSGDVVAERTLPSDLIEDLLGSITDQLEVGFAACANDLLIGNREYSALRGRKRRSTWNEVESIRELRAHKIHYASIRSLHLNSDELANEIETLCDTKAVSIRVASPSVVDLVPHDVSKSTGAAALAEHLGIAPESVVAYGDMPNDIDLLAWAGLSVAVASGHPDLIAVADVVAASADEDGVASDLQSVLASAM